jgi:hypothetical protein
MHGVKLVLAAHCRVSLHARSSEPPDSPEPNYLHVVCAPTVSKPFPGCLG